MRAISASTAAARCLGRPALRRIERIWSWPASAAVMRGVWSLKPAWFKSAPKWTSSDTRRLSPREQASLSGVARPLGCMFGSARRRRCSTMERTSCGTAASQSPPQPAAASATSSAVGRGGWSCDVWIASGAGMVAWASPSAPPWSSSSPSPAAAPPCCTGGGGSGGASPERTSDGSWCERRSMATSARPLRTARCSGVRPSGGAWALSRMRRPMTNPADAPSSAGSGRRG
mmetsp:Transcript_18780/g.71490  ORF Transcript_18780/g.71490 Transcript_18780/m.71490 type:complete len:231 (+) Transcript_18780:61-753(+)